MSEDRKLPSVESINQLFNDLNTSLNTFMEANPEVESQFVFIAAIRAMLVYPLDWMRNAGTSDQYLEMMEDHIKAVFASYLINDESNKTEE